MQSYEVLQVQADLITVLACCNDPFDIIAKPEVRLIFRGDDLYTDLASDGEWKGFYWKLQHESTPYQTVIVYGIQEISKFITPADSNTSLKYIVDAARSKGLTVHITLEP